MVHSEHAVVGGHLIYKGNGGGGVVEGGVRGGGSVPCCRSRVRSGLGGCCRSAGDAFALSFILPFTYSSST